MAPLQPATTPKARRSPEGVVLPLAFTGDEAALVEGLLANHPGAKAAFFQRYVKLVERIVTHVIGFDSELADILQEVFAGALASIHTLNDPSALTPWLAAWPALRARCCAGDHAARGCGVSWTRRKKSATSRWRVESMSRLSARYAPSTRSSAPCQPMSESRSRCASSTAWSSPKLQHRAKSRWRRSSAGWHGPSVASSPSRENTGVSTVDRGRYTMARPVTPLGSLGAKVAATLEADAGDRDRAIEVARRQFLAQAVQPQPAKRRIGRGLAMAMAAALCVVAVVLSAYSRRPGPLQFDVDGTAGVAQTWLAAPAARAMVVNFSDGTILHIDPSSRARVVDIDQHGASISLESGLIHADVVHTSHSAWRMIAGPFAIRVTGTRFDVRWDSASQKFSIAVREGSVAVSGSIVGAERPVRAGEKLLVSVVQGRLDLVNAETAGAGLPPTTTARKRRLTMLLLRPKLPPQKHLYRRPQARSTSHRKDPRRILRSGRERARQKWRPPASVRRCRSAWLSGAVVDPATPAELLLLGDAARLSGRSIAPPKPCSLFAGGTRAIRDALRPRSRWARSLLISATRTAKPPNGLRPRRKKSSRTGRWPAKRPDARSNHYEMPGIQAGAQRAARQYLARYPDGPHADVARSLLK